MCSLRSVDKDQSHVIGGLKATISNPNTSTEAKEHAAERLEELGQPRYSSPGREPAAPHELGTHQIAGYKATISSLWDSLDLVSGYLKFGYPFTDPNTSEKAKEHAREVLEAESEQEATHVERSPHASAQEQHTKRVIAGYKAAIHSTSLGFFPLYHPLRVACYEMSDPPLLQILRCPRRPRNMPGKNWTSTGSLTEVPPPLICISLSVFVKTRNVSRLGACPLPLENLWASVGC